MLIRHYIGLIHQEANSDFSTSFPDLPPLVSAGSVLDDARTAAEEALEFHIEGLIANREATPEPSSLGEIMSDPE